MNALLKQVRSIQSGALASIEQCSDLESLRTLEVKLLGRKGEVTRALHGLKDLPEDERRLAGQVLNELKKSVEEALARRRSGLEAAAMEASLSGGRLDPTEPSARRPLGHEHPVQAIVRELCDLFESMGFTVIDGPEVESEYFNFEALNIPSWHPARDMQDTFWVAGRRAVMRTHTSGMQIRAMRRYGAPLRVVAPGRVFRYEAQDASHEHTFHQLEGLVVDEGIAVSHLKGTLEAMLRGLFKNRVVTRLRPFYFPFVEPGLELDFGCLLCEQKGCPACKGTGWIELCGCGMVHPRVL